ncbi:MAG: ABC transporter permease [Chloroflexi bacterium HGW-Chloroflexi-10]|nr:MAG: ABC transporter permease [Chloroflexi bacterium HGW-Chloroflexi-10]
MNRFQRVWVVFQKEVRDNMRDQRSIYSALGSSLIGPVLILLMIVVLGQSIFKDIQESNIDLAVLGSENAPSFILFLEQNGVNILPAPADPQEAVRNGDLDVVLMIPEGYGEDFRAGTPATVQIVIDSSRQSASARVSRVRELVQGYAAQTGAQRLLARGINPAITQPLALERVDVATPQSQVTIFLNMMPYFIILVIFVGGMYVVIDTTAGERERGSLEPLLINPITRAEFVWGKLLASIPFALFALAVTLLAFYAAFNLFPVEDYIGMQLTLNPVALFQIFLLSLPMVVLASALQMVVATFTRSFKEAQTYVSFLPLIPAIPGIGLAFLPVKPSMATMLIPTFGQQILINQLMRGENVMALNVLVSTLATLFLSGILIWIAIRLYRQERILFGGK